MDSHAILDSYTTELEREYQHFGKNPGFFLLRNLKVIGYSQLGTEPIPVALGKDRSCSTMQSLFDVFPKSVLFSTTVTQTNVPGT